jgi:transcriptional regulator with XRE-family HTH domain
MTDAGTTLGGFLRAHRARLSPQLAGLPAAARRRTPGLRREEVAMLCGLSVTWYSWMEQGRNISVSPAALARLAGVLRLNPAERAYLFDLARKRDPAGPHVAAPAPESAPLIAAVRAMPMPAYLLDRHWTAIAWNRPAEDLFASWLDGDEPNLLRFIFLIPAARSLIRDWEDRARRVLAEFRADAGRHAEDPGMAALIVDLRRRSRYFSACWDAQAVLAREGGLRRFSHPRRGALAFEQITLAPAGMPEAKLVLLLPAQEVAGGVVV